MAVKYHVPVTEKFEWQQAVADKDLTAPPVSPAPAKGDRYLIATGATGAWETKDGNITYYDGAGWQFVAPKAGMHVWAIDEKKVYVYDGTAWAVEGAGIGDMLKSDYATGGIAGTVDKAAAVNDGTNSATAADIAAAVAAKHTQGTDTTLGAMTADIDANSHKVKNLAVPAANGDAIRATAKITEANLESAIDRKASYVAEYEALEFEI